MAGEAASFEAFRQLVDMLLRATVLAPTGGLRLVFGPAGRTRGVLGGFGGPTDPLPLRDGRFLRLSVSLWLADTEQGPRLKVAKSGYQYQMSQDGKAWICRYDYLREPGEDPHPQAHVQINGSLAALPNAHLHRVHFPTGRISIEAVLRMLVEQFDVPTALPPDRWRPLLAASERAFEEIAHRPLSGPLS
jgi:hypothetical protein